MFKDQPSPTRTSHWSSRDVNVVEHDLSMSVQAAIESRKIVHDLPWHGSVKAFCVDGKDEHREIVWSASKCRDERASI